MDDVGGEVIGGFNIDSFQIGNYQVTSFSVDFHGVCPKCRTQQHYEDGLGQRDKRPNTDNSF